MKTAKIQFEISKLANPEHQGDWHDKPLRWVVTGPEVQKFSTKKEALLWVKIRRNSLDFRSAVNAFVAAK